MEEIRIQIENLHNEIMDYQYKLKKVQREEMRLMDKIIVLQQRLGELEKKMLTEKTNDR